MPEPTLTTGAVVAAVVPPAAVAPIVVIAGVSLGLRADVLIAGLAGAIAAIALLDTAPGEMDTLKHMLGTTSRRLFVAVSSALVAGYMLPVVQNVVSLPDAALLGIAFVTGAGAQRLLKAAVNRFASKVEG